MAGVMDKLKNRAANTQAGAERVILIPLENVKFDPLQPRKAYHTLDGLISKEASDYIDELAISIQENGLIEPIIVQEQADGTYLVVVGECRTRAHQKLGVATIKALVRNDLISPSKRLLFQIAENVNRENLTEDELAASIRWLLENGDDGKPMKQVQVAKAFGKQESWVTKYLKFGDEEVQRVWVRSGVASGVDAAYLLSKLPAPLQMDILRRVSLAEDDREFLSKPISRRTIDEYRDEAKRIKFAESTKAVAAGAAGNAESEAAGAASAQGGSSEPVANSNAAQDAQEAASATAAGGDRQVDPIAAAMQEQFEAEQQQRNLENAAAGNAASAPAATYKLDDQARAAIMAQALGTAASLETVSTKEIGQAPVNCRISARNVASLLKLLDEDAELQEQAMGVRCDVIIPAGLAAKIANKLAGVIVDERELSSVMQNELGKLG